MNVPPILHCENWAELVAALAEHAGWEPLAALRPALAAGVLAAPAAIARSLAARAPRLAERRALSLLVIGAESVDAPDQGRWYQAIPAMLASACSLRVTLIGASLDVSFATAAAQSAPVTAAHCARSGLVEFLDAHPHLQFDVAAMFQPGFQKYRDWLGDAGLTRLLAAGTLLIGSSNAGDEYQMERWVLECYGYRVSEQALPNPFYLELGDAASSIHWGGALWQIEAAPPPDWRVDTGRLAALDTLTRMVMHSMTVVGAPSPPCGAKVELSGGKGLRRTMIHLFDQRFVDPADGGMVELTADGALTPIGRLPVDELKTLPGDGVSEIGRAIWAADIKARFLLASYPATNDVAAGAAVTRAMFDDMRSRAADLFR